jgi:hypothetical protein
MALEEIEINKDNLNVDTFKTLIANVAEQINIKLQNEEGIPLEDIDKSVTQINNAYSMLVTVNSDTNDRDISAIEQMKVSFDNAIDDIQTKLDNGDFNGEDGQSFTFDMFTPEQLESLKVKGDDGQPFTFDMFTPEQLESLKVKGDDGEPFTYDMFTPEQLESLKVKGDDGKPFTYDDLTPEQKEDLKQGNGKVLQFKHYTSDAPFDTTSTSYQDAVSLDFKPVSENSIVLIEFSGHFFKYDNVSAGYSGARIIYGDLIVRHIDYLNYINSSLQYMYEGGYRAILKPDNLDKYYPHKQLYVFLKFPH